MSICLIPNSLIKIIKFCVRAILLNGLLHGFYLISHLVIRKTRSFFYQIVLDAPGINVGPDCIFINIKLIKFGKDIYINNSLWIEAIVFYRNFKYSPCIQIGDRVIFSKGVHVSAIHQITIGNDVLFGSHVYISDHNHGGYSKNLHSNPNIAPIARELVSFGDVIIEDNVWIGDNVNIVGPVRIGKGSIVAANSVVRGDIPSKVIVAGAPAVIIKVFNERSELWEATLQK